MNIVDTENLTAGAGNGDLDQAETLVGSKSVILTAGIQQSIGVVL